MGCACLKSHTHSFLGALFAAGHHSRSYNAHKLAAASAFSAGAAGLRLLKEPHKLVFWCFNCCRPQQQELQGTQARRSHCVFCGGCGTAFAQHQPCATFQAICTPSYTHPQPQQEPPTQRQHHARKRTHTARQSRSSCRHTHAQPPRIVSCHHTHARPPRAVNYHRQARS